MEFPCPKTLLSRGTKALLPAAPQPEGLKEADELVEFYKENARILRECFQSLGFSVYGGDNAPYVWVGFPGKPSWDVFAEVGPLVVDVHFNVLQFPYTWGIGACSLCLVVNMPGRYAVTTSQPAR